MKLKDINNSIIVWGPISGEGLEELKKEKRIIIVAESRPSILGLKHNVPLLEAENIPYVYCTDNALGFLFYKNKVDKTYIFYRNIKENGILGLPGSFFIALLSRLHNIGIQVMPGAESYKKSTDEDASTLDGKLLTTRESNEEYILKPELEFIPQEVFN